MEYTDIDRSGSMADVPKDLLERIKELEQLFTVDVSKLKEVMNHFVKELEKGVFYIPQYLENPFR